MRGTAGLSPFSMISQAVNQRHLVKQVRTPPGWPADGVVMWCYESFVLRESCRELGRRRRYNLRSTWPLSDSICVGYGLM